MRTEIKLDGLESLAAIAVLMVAILESILTRAWSRWYFSWGILLFRVRIPNRSAALPSASKLDEVLDQGLPDLAIIPSKKVPIAFHQLSDEAMGFQQKNLSVFLMRGSIRLERVESILSVSGFANWYYVAFVALVCFLSIRHLHDLNVIWIGAFALLALQLWRQYVEEASRFNTVVELVRSQASAVTAT